MSVAPLVTGGDRRRVLVVDDNPDDAEVLAIAADGMSPPLAIEVVESGEEALSLVTSAGAVPPTAVLLDWNLSGIDTTAVIRAIRASATWAAVPVIVCSGHDDPSIARTALERGADRFEAKPVGIDAVASMLERVMALTTPA